MISERHLAHSGFGVRYDDVIEAIAALSACQAVDPLYRTIAWWG
jgi:hypothetical protein